MISSRLSVIIVAAATLAVVGCGSTERAAPKQTRSAHLDRYPAKIVGAFGTSRTSAYDSITGARLSDRPYSRANGRVFRDVYSYLELSGPEELAARSRVVVLGTVTAIGRPHFNSDNGAFWHPALHHEAGVPDVANEIFRDVVLRVDDVWGSLLPGVRSGSALTFVSRGGQVQVTLPDAVARQAELGPGGNYVFTSDPPVDLAVGERTLLFLNSIGIDGLYGGRYGYRFKLAPANDISYKYTIQGDRAVNAHGGSFNTSVGELRAAVAANLGRSAGPEPREGVFPEPRENEP